MSETTKTEQAVPQQPDGDPREQEINTAAAFLSIDGPCRQVANVYLACVATAGLGMCRHLRANFEDCAKSTRQEAREQITFIGGATSQCEKHDDQTLCAAQMALKHYLPPQQQE